MSEEFFSELLHADSRNLWGVMGQNADTDQMPDAPAELLNATGAGRVFLVCEHASAHIPAQYDALGLDGEARLSHVAWDPGADAVARRMSEQLDAPLLHARVSRLVYDCNRPPEAPGAMPAQVERYRIPGNEGLSPAEKAARVAQVYDPFRRALAAALAARPAPPVLVTVHSFTPVYMGQPRPTEIGILHDSDTRLADAMLARARDHSPLIFARNDPYGPEDGVTHTLKLHGIENGLLNVMIEIRNDLIAAPADQHAMADMLAGLLAAALADCPADLTEDRCRA